MATYKVIQDIEAEDKLVGPLTLRQFIYAILVIAMGFIAFKLAAVSPAFVIPFLPPMIFFGLLAAPLGGAQSSEVWLLAKIRFFLKPKRRIWDQTGMLDLVQITVPKKVERHLTNGLSQIEVKSRLQALATTLDSRGWAVKNVNVNLYQNPSYFTTDSSADRLVQVDALPQDVPNYEVAASDDMMDTRYNPTAQQLDAMIAQSEQAHRQSLMASVQAPPATQNIQPYQNLFMNPSAQAATGLAAPVAADDNSAADKALLEKIHKEKARPNPMNSHLHVLNPRGADKPKTNHKNKSAEHKPTASSHRSQAADQPVQNPAVVSLATNNDLSVATIAHEAQKSLKPEQGDGEVVVNLR